MHKANLKKSLRSYLDDIQAIQDILKQIVGPPLPQKSWRANIPDRGAFPRFGITDFYRHGVGIKVTFQGRVVDFDFMNNGLSEEENRTNRCLAIDKWFFTEYLKSIDKHHLLLGKFLETGMEELVNEGILTKRKGRFYFVKDIS